eukprot:CAMPEP_0173102928 /NCGR_PEP_ID=MMETSP1102-20130122/37970_1 /TAXON_ID=49646 /ORGANISM="Geminigera sp., Strain Caron Lab Isolate" /LENGTH=78 /DNA_ID=CAMNT_0013997413 /DNA_START=159 /DNA_END=391 /DNA_ORIENTATION=+
MTPGPPTYQMTAAAPNEMTPGPPNYHMTPPPTHQMNAAAPNETTAAAAKWDVPRIRAKVLVAACNIELTTPSSTALSP